MDRVARRRRRTGRRSDHAAENVLRMTVTIADVPRARRKHHLLPMLAAACLFSVIALGLDPRMPFTLTNGVVLNDPVHPGGDVMVDWTQDWTRRCKAESTRSVTSIAPRPGIVRKADTFEPVTIEPPAHNGPRQATAGVELSKVMPTGPAVYRAVVNFPRQFSAHCVILWPMGFTTQDVLFTVAD